MSQVDIAQKRNELLNRGHDFVQKVNGAGLDVKRSKPLASLSRSNSHSSNAQKF